MERILNLPLSSKHHDQQSEYRFLYDSHFSQINYNKAIDNFFSAKYQRISPILTGQNFDLLIQEIIKKNLKPKYTNNLRRTIIRGYNVEFWKGSISNELFSRIYTSSKYYQKSLLINSFEKYKNQIKS
jgi:hypothetical protein